ncbi:MAG: aspartate--ammonia ligase [Thermoguttaceae bacterium]
MTDYKAKLAPEMMEQAIDFLKTAFQKELATRLNLRRVTAPLFVLSGTGINDDLNGIERAVSFPIRALGDRRAEVVHSLAKWKRMKLAAYNITPGYGLYTDMNAIRADEDLDALHSLYVDQWDWEQTIREEDRSLEYLKKTVRNIFQVLKTMEQKVCETFHHITPILPDEITFIHSEDLLRMYPNLSPKERENRITEKFGAVFLIGIGSVLENGEKHDGRAPDYDDWSTETSPGYKGLNGDLLVWNPILRSSLELSSMGVRVDKAALLRQLEIAGCPDRQSLFFHSLLLNDELPFSIGGGIGQSRTCLFLFRCAHVGEVQASIWPDSMIEDCRKRGIFLMS